MRRLMLGLSVVALACASNGALAQPAGAAEVNKLHVLLVIDTDSNLGESVRADERRMRSLVDSNIPASRRTLTVLTGKDASREKVLAYYRSVNAAADDGLLFYYSGHGGTDPQKGHFLQLLGASTTMFRSELRAAMKARKTASAILLTDCCSNTIKASKPREVKPSIRKPGDKVDERVSDLFFRARGVVDVTASTGEIAWGDSEGGLFTRTFCDLIEQGRGKRLNWDKFFPQLQRQTEEEFTRWRETARLSESEAKLVRRIVQRPQAFSLGQPPEPVKAEATSPTPSVTAATALLVVRNETGAPLKYRYCWSTQKEWKESELAVGKAHLHTLRLPSAAPQGLRLLAEMPSNSFKLEPKIHNQHVPSTAEGANRYVLRTNATNKSTARGASELAISADLE